jgi:hypothetical protein
MTPEMEIGTDRKALQINLDPAKYGTFAGNWRRSGSSAVMLSEAKHL